MNFGRITKEQAVKETSIKIIENLENSSVDFTNRIVSESPGYVEFSAAAKLENNEDYDMVVMYVFVDGEELKKLEELDQLDWGKIIADTAEFELI